MLVLDEAVLSVAQRYRENVLAVPRDQDVNRGYRHTAFRVVPSCCVWQIRDKFPDSFEQYTGFKDGRLD